MMSYHEDSARIKDLEGLLHAAQVKNYELEAERDALQLKCDYQDELKAERDALEAHCAVMREYLQRREWSHEGGGMKYCCPQCFNQEAKGHYENCALGKALAPDAGAALLERLAKAESKVQHMRKCTDEILEISDLVETELAAKLAKAEAERVEDYTSRAFCSDSGCIPHKNNDHSNCFLCEAYQFHQYLRKHKMIREAE